jgi:hypothetical protein
MLNTIPNLPRFVIPEGYDWVSRLSFSLDDYTVTPVGNNQFGYTVYRCDGNNHTFYVTSEVYRGSHWVMESDSMS